MDIMQTTPVIDFYTVVTRVTGDDSLTAESDV